jgi:hypothetical protein
LNPKEIRMSSTSDHIVIVAAKRTPIGAFRNSPLPQSRRL